MRRIGAAPRRAALIEDLAAIRRRWSALPVLDRRSADAIIGYDEKGLPR
jgi:antitoxin VapB